MTFKDKKNRHIISQKSHSDLLNFHCCTTLSWHCPAGLLGWSMTIKIDFLSSQHLYFQHSVGRVQEEHATYKWHVSRTSPNMIFVYCNSSFLISILHIETLPRGATQTDCHRQSHSLIQQESPEREKKHTGCLTSYLDAVPVGGVHDGGNQVLCGLPVVVRHPGRIPGQHQHPCNNTTRRRAVKFECDAYWIIEVSFNNKKKPLWSRKHKSDMDAFMRCGIYWRLLLSYTLQECVMMFGIDLKCCHTGWSYFFLHLANRLHYKKGKYIQLFILT